MVRASWWLMQSQMKELAEALKTDQLEAYIAEHPEG